MRLRMKRKKGPVDRELDVRCKVYENGRVAADPETLRLLAQFSERGSEEWTGCPLALGAGHYLLR